MFIRATSQKNIKTKSTYTTYRLVESYRGQLNKVKQRTLLNLGTGFDMPKENWSSLTVRIEELLHGQLSMFEFDETIEKEARRIVKVLEKKYSTKIDDKQENKKETDFQNVDLNSLEHGDVRKIGAEHVGYHAAKQLNLEAVLEEVGFNSKQINEALGSIIGRLIYPGSELSTHRYLQEYSALDELLETDFSKLSLKNLYKISDKLLNKKDKIENLLYQRERDLFNLEEVITLYDITNTYFEGQCNNNQKAQYGRSKEKRYDCRLVALGMVLDDSGFPKKSNIFPGNISEPKTMKDMLDVLGATPNATVVMDAGFATEENIQWLKDSNYQYIVVSRKRNQKAPDEVESVLVKDSENNKVHAKLVKNAETDELELYCHSQAKEAKSKEVVSKAQIKYQNELEKLKVGLTKKSKGCLKKYEKVMEKLGRLKESHKRVSYLYEVTIKGDDKNKNAIGLFWKLKENIQSNNHNGTYCLRTNRKDLDEETFWNIYTMLTDLEAAFRSLKSELGLRPVYHQKEIRVDGHIFISILAYHLLHTIRYQLKLKHINYSWQTIRELLQTHCRITSSLQHENGKMIKIRKTTKPDVAQAAIYNALGIETQPLKTEKIYH